MCKNCGCGISNRSVQYKCDCKDEDCNCNTIIEFDAVPNKTPYCCDTPMKRIK